MDGGSALGRWAARATGASGRSKIDALSPHWLDQQHGAVVKVARASEPPGTLGTGDALVSADAWTQLSMVTADCASIALGSEEGVFGAVHAGWRGLVAGTVQAAVDVMRSLGATAISGAAGPMIHRECYEFSAQDLATVADCLGGGVRAQTPAGKPALDLPAAVAAAFDRAGVQTAFGVEECTACSTDYFSHRARGDESRQAMVVWSDAGR